jgi:osmotically-inducible protein OsmY
MKSDAQLRQDVLSELSWTPSIDVTRITVEVREGNVTLTGYVDSYTTKSRVEDVVQHVAGVNSVTVRMDVELIGSSKRSDADIARSARDALQSTTYVAKDAVRVVVHDGRVTLSGELDWDWQRQGAVRTVRHLLGIIDVSDRILIKFNPSTTVMQGDIEAALQRHAISDAQAIGVKVRGSSVTLTGTVGTWSERDLAVNCAWSAPGVRSVANNLTVARQPGAGAPGS